MPNRTVYVSRYQSCSDGDGQMRLYLTPDASRYLLEKRSVRRTPSTLNKYRVVGGGPKFRRIGAKQVAYEEGDLDAYAKDLIGVPLRSTSEAA